MRRLAPLLLLTLIAPTCLADTPGLGRLFFDSQQRSQLDQQRQRNPWFGQQNQNDNEAGLTLNGEVRSSSGRRTRWINGEADWGNTAPLPQVPVGNTYYPESGESTPILGKGQLTIKPGRR